MTKKQNPDYQAEAEYLKSEIKKIGEVWNGKHDFKQMHNSLIVIQAIVKRALDSG